MAAYSYQYFFILCVIIYIILFVFWKRFRRTFYKPYPNETIQLKEVEFYTQFEDKIQNNKSEERWKELLDKAWEVRDFEIDLYWRRANYFWLFQLPAFTAYFTIGKNIGSMSKPDEIFVIDCLGIIFSTAWLLINRGSKSWQRHWESYIDLLEDKYYGPLYKTINIQKSFSVSKINEIVSGSFIVVWVLFAINYLFLNGYLRNIKLSISAINPLLDFSIFFTIVIVFSMLFGHGRGYFRDRGIKMYKRKTHYVNP